MSIEITLGCMRNQQGNMIYNNEQYLTPSAVSNLHSRLYGHKSRHMVIWLDNLWILMPLDSNVSDNKLIHKNKKNIISQMHKSVTILL